MHPELQKTITTKTIFMSNTSKPSGYFTNWNNLPLLASTRDITINLTVEERLLIANQIQVLLRDYYAHLPQKKSALGIDPVQHSKVIIDLAKNLPAKGYPGFNPELEFFNQILKLLSSLCDRHTSFTLPPPWTSMIAVLPFTLETCFENNTRKVLVSKVSVDLGDPAFQPGVEVTHWGGIPIGKYIENLANKTGGAHPQARISVAVRSLTVRPLGYMEYPDEDWTTLTFIPLIGGYKSISIPWKVYLPETKSAAANALQEVPVESGSADLQGVDSSTLLINGTLKDIFAGDATHPATGEGQPVGKIANPLPDNVIFGEAETTAGKYGYLRIFSFDYQNPDEFVRGCIDILKSLPQNGLIIDVRSNPGGTIPCGEGLAQLLTAQPVQSLPLTFRNSESIKKVIDATGDLFSRWKLSVDMLLDTGQEYSQGFGLTPTEVVRNLGYTYPGKIVVIIDGLCYSTTDFFAALVQDHGIGQIIGTDGFTGGGGANVWTHKLLTYYLKPYGEFKELPRGTNLNISLRLALRVGARAGLPLEGIGVEANHVYSMTRKDILSKNEDLLEFAAQILKKM